MKKQILTLLATATVSLINLDFAEASDLFKADEENMDSPFSGNSSTSQPLSDQSNVSVEETQINFNATRRLIIDQNLLTYMKDYIPANKQQGQSGKNIDGKKISFKYRNPYILGLGVEVPLATTNPMPQWEKDAPSTYYYVHRPSGNLRQLEKNAAPTVPKGTR